jgi:hypothetical protein
MPQTHNPPVLVGSQTPTSATGRKREREAKDSVSSKRRRTAPVADLQQTASAPIAPRRGGTVHFDFDNVNKSAAETCQDLKEVRGQLGAGQLKSLSLSFAATVTACKELSAILDPAAGLEVLIVELIQRKSAKGLESFFETLEQATGLRKLDWQHQYVDRLIPRLNAMTGLKTLIMGSNGWTQEASPDLLNTLKQNRNIENLKLDSLSDRNTDQLFCELLQVNGSLKAIEVHGWDASKIRAIANGLRANKTLEKLAFTCSFHDWAEIEEFCRVMPELYDAVSAHPKLTVVKFNWPHEFKGDQKVALAALEAKAKMQDILRDRQVPQVANALARLADFAPGKIYMPNEILKLLAMHWLDVDSFALVKSEQV